ncbi:organelle RRM domain-containing protein 6, chloroplastic-like [Impatiens glandulifera]|uniref:organelle RRM domain-containing protein 6, chloroplastic-like n=1 Tax=Impatiens glandulifera TaxID=253017 RepID=UPI001FB1156C|nr:organelle RRM domain-containing protein 6, chloroplastic-like [Impatiens glandulifera]XP_047316252.1 organelle RRM domain-containing protein 6, chloroplastic-like [Impatiens glandulifera]
MVGLACIGSIATSSQMVQFPTKFFDRNINDTRLRLRPFGWNRIELHVPSPLCLDSNMRNFRVIISALPFDTTHDDAGVARPLPNKLYVSGLSFRTTEEGLRNVFEKFGRLVEVNLVMDRIARRSRGFGFIRYVNEEEAKKAIEGMHGKFLDGRVIFVEVAKPPRPRTD